MKYIVKVLLLAPLIISCSNIGKEDKANTVITDSLFSESVQIGADTTLYIDTTKRLSSPLENLIHKCADSIIQMSEHKRFPKFLLNADFDMQNTAYWPSTHTPISLRNEILKEVVSCEKLKLIFTSKDKHLDIKPTELKYSSSLIELLPLKGSSTRELIRMRINELNCN